MAGCFGICNQILHPTAGNPGKAYTTNVDNFGSATQ